MEFLVCARVISNAASSSYKRMLFKSNPSDLSGITFVLRVKSASNGAPGGYLAELPDQGLEPGKGRQPHLPAEAWCRGMAGRPSGSVPFPGLQGLPGPLSLLLSKH